MKPNTPHAPLPADAGQETIARLDKIRNAKGSLRTAEIRKDMQKIMQNNAAVFRTQVRRAPPPLWSPPLPARLPAAPARPPHPPLLLLPPFPPHPTSPPALLCPPSNPLHPPPSKLAIALATWDMLLGGPGCRRLWRRAATSLTTAWRASRT